MERRKHRASTRRQLHQLGDLGRRNAHRLVDDDVFPCFDGLTGVFEMAIVGRGDDNQIQRGVGQHIVKRAVSGDAGIPLGGVVGGALDNGS
jgi:hypothetical protein